MPLYIEKSPITIVGMGAPIIITNMLAHKVIDEDTSRLMLLSTVGAELNTLQHFGHNSRRITIKGRINLVTDTGLSNFDPLKGGAGANIEMLLTGLKILKETKSAVLVIMNHSVCYGVIDKIIITDDREYPTAFDYECHIVEKDLYGLKLSAISQRILSGIAGLIPVDKKRLVRQETVVPSFSDLLGE